MVGGIHLSESQTALLRQTGGLIDHSCADLAATYIYDEFGNLPGGSEYLYDLSVRIRSTARLLVFLVEQVADSPVGASPIEKMFESIGISHAKAGLPLMLVEEGPDIFARSLARVVGERGGEWNAGHTAVWRELIQQGVEVQKRAYSAAA